MPALSVYSASKAAVRSFARTWSTDLEGKNIRVNVISPGVVPTPGYQQMVPGIPLGRVGTTDEVASPSSPPTRAATWRASSYSWTEA